MEISKILLVGRNGYYNPVRKTQDGLNLEPDLTKEQINARMVVPYGFAFRFGEIGGVDFGVRGYTHQDYFKIKSSTGKSYLENEDYGRINIDLTIKGLEELVRKKGANFVLIENLESRDSNTFWRVNGSAQLLISTEMLGTPA